MTFQKQLPIDVKGEILDLKNTINTMVEQLNSFASEVTRVAREVGTEGKLGGQAEVKGVAGTWKDLDRLCEHDGIEPDQPGAWYCKSGNIGGNGNLQAKTYPSMQKVKWHS